jgi:hypothetical protein
MIDENTTWIGEAAGGRFEQLGLACVIEGARTVAAAAGLVWPENRARG